MAIHPSATIDPSAKVDKSNHIGPGCVIGPHCEIGPNNIFMNGAIIGTRTRIGSENTFHYHSVVGHDPQYLGFNPETKSGTVIGNGNHFREFSSVHRGLHEGSNTVVGDSNFVMAYAHVAHDCAIGNNCVLVNYAGLSGHIHVENNVFISGHVAIHQFVRIGSYSMVGGGAVVSKDVPPFMTLKNYGTVIGINAVGLRRAGFSSEQRINLKNAYKRLFREGHSVKRGLQLLQEDYSGMSIPEEVQALIDFCTAESKRGLSRGPRSQQESVED